MHPKELMMAHLVNEMEYFHLERRITENYKANLALCKRRENRKE